MRARGSKDVKRRVPQCVGGVRERERERERERVYAHVGEREKKPFDSSFYFSPPLGLPYANWA